MIAKCWIDSSHIQSNTYRHRRDLHYHSGQKLRVSGKWWWEYHGILLSLGKDIELIRPSLTPHSKNADLMMDGVVWEMKCPQGKSRYCIERLFRKAAHQAQNLILDLRLIQITNQQALTTIDKLFMANRHVLRIFVVDKTGRLIDMKR